MYDLSIVIPTHKPDYSILEKTLKAIHNTNKVLDKTIDLIVVENPVVTSETNTLCNKYGARTFQSQLGANNARNTGVYHSYSNNIAMLDDDCVIHSNWFENVMYNLKIKNLECFGGKVTLVPAEKEFPWWLIKPFTISLAEIDYGNVFRKIEPHEHLVSANLVFTRLLYNKVGGFNANLGYFGRNMIPNDEVLFINTAREHTDVYYDASVEISHIIPEYRTTKEYLVNKYYGQGIADVLLRKECGEHIKKFPKRDSAYWGTQAGILKDKEDEWLDLYNFCELAYAVGINHASLGKKPCQNIYSLLLDVLDLG